MSVNNRTVVVCGGLGDDPGCGPLVARARTVNNQSDSCPLPFSLAFRAAALSQLQQGGARRYFRTLHVHDLRMQYEDVGPASTYP